MNLFYAMGGGWGHLTRVSTFIDQLGVSDFRILTNNPLAEKMFTTDQIITISGSDRIEIVQMVRQKLATLEFEKLYVDAFPVGLFGELNELNKKMIIYLARRLRWNEYSKLVDQPTIQFDQTYCLEELEDGHQRFVEQTSRTIMSMKLQYALPDTTKIPASQIPKNKLIWLVVHSFIQEEVESLISYAKEMARIEHQTPIFVVLTDQVIKDADVYCYDFYPAIHWFPLADRIFAGGGFNTLHQAAQFKKKLRVIPFPRKYDDQTWRTAQFNEMI